MKKYFVFLFLAGLAILVYVFQKSPVVVDSFKVLAPLLFPIKISYQFDRYETCGNTSYHNVIVIRISKKVPWRKLKYLEIQDAKNNFSVKYNIAHEKSGDDRVYYHMNLFGKSKHYEYIEDANSDEFYIFYYYSYYPSLKNKKSFIQVRGVGEGEVFKTEKISVDYSRQYDRNQFPIFKKVQILQNPKKLKVNIMRSRKSSIEGYFQWKFKGQIIIKDFDMKPNQKEITRPIGPYDEYLAVMISHSVGGEQYENKLVVYQKECFSAYFDD